MHLRMKIAAGAAAGAASVALVAGVPALASGHASASGGASLALAPSPRLEQRGSGGQTFRLHEFVKSFVSEDPTGTAQPGELFMIHSVLKTTTGTQAGVLDYMCTDLSKPPNGVFHCEGTATFNDGATIEFTGLGKTSSLDFTVAVTGGTGRFLASEGQIFFHGTSPTQGLDTFTLVG